MPPAPARAAPRDPLTASATGDPAKGDWKATKPAQRAAAAGSSSAASASSPPLLWAITSAGRSDPTSAARMRAALAATEAAVGTRTTSGAAPIARNQSCCAHM